MPDHREQRGTGRVCLSDPVRDATSGPVAAPAGGLPGANGTVWAGLAASVATLLCCVLPSLLVVAGFGATVAAVTSAAPWLVALSRNKEWVFLAAAVLILGSRLYVTGVVPRVGTKGGACPTSLGRWTRRVWWLSVVLWTLGALAVYVVGPLLLAAAP